MPCVAVVVQAFDKILHVSSIARSYFYEEQLNISQQWPVIARTLHHLGHQTLIAQMLAGLAKYGQLQIDITRW